MLLNGVNYMAKPDQIIKPLLKDTVTDIFGGEDLLIEAARDLARQLGCERFLVR